MSGSSSFDWGLFLLGGEFLDLSPLTGDFEGDFSGVLIGYMLNLEGDICVVFGEE